MPLPLTIANCFPFFSFAYNVIEPQHLEFALLALPGTPSKTPFLSKRHVFVAGCAGYALPKFGWMSTRRLGTCGHRRALSFGRRKVQLCTSTGIPKFALLNFSNYFSFSNYS